MRNLKALLGLFLCLLAMPASATTSTINPLSPSDHASLTASLFRNQYAAAYNDINALWAAVGNQAAAPQQIVTPPVSTATFGVTSAHCGWLIPLSRVGGVAVTLLP